MGLERLVAVLNNSNSSFDSDLFQPIFEAISRHSNKPAYGGKFGEDSELDTAYRILADHLRMIVVCLADQVFPDQNHRLKFVLRRAFSIANNTFQAPPGILKELSNHVIETLGPTFPVIQNRENIIKLILDFEEDNYSKFIDKSTKSYHQLKQEFAIESQSVELTDATPFLEAFRLLDKERILESLDSRLAYKLYESHGMQEQDIVKLCSIRNIQFDLDEFNRYLTCKKGLSKLSTSQAQGLSLMQHNSGVLPGTDDSSKYAYTRTGGGQYEFPVVADAIILQIVSDGIVVGSLQEGEEGMIFLDKTCFYSEAGGQVGDTGIITTQTATFKVTKTHALAGNLVAHMGHLTSGTLRSYEVATASIDAERRLQAMQNHSATHVLNSVLHTLLPLTAQKSSLVKPEYLRYDFSCYNADTNLDFVRQLEDGVLTMINDGRPIHSSVVENTKLASVDNLVTLPGEVYPDNVTLVDIDGVHTEPCCGTHLHNTKDIENFVIVGFKSASSGVKSVRCLTGDSARLARENGVKVCEDILSYQEKMSSHCDNIDKGAMQLVEKQISSWNKQISGIHNTYMN
jgi:alanyl-tRNA synthetase